MRAIHQASPTWRMWAAVVLAAVVLPACGGGDAGDPVSTTDPAVPAPVSGEGLDDFLGYPQIGIGGPDEEYLRKLGEQYRRAEDLIVECMAAQGFEYAPEWVEFEPDERPRYETVAESRAAQGYGVFIWLLEAAEQAGEEEVDPAGPPPENPNDTILESLSAAEQEAWWFALDGGPDFYEPGEWEEQHPGEPRPEIDPAQAGCRRLAEQEVFGSSEERTALETELDPLRDELEARLAADSRVVDAKKAWARCMADQGHSFSSEDDIYDYLGGKYNELHGLEPYPETPVTTEAAPPEDDSGPLPPGATIEMVRALFAEELAIAAADVKCSAARDATIDAVRLELESQFIADHRDMLEKLRDLIAVEGA